MTRTSLPPTDRASKRTPDPDPTPPATDAVPLAMVYTTAQVALLLNVSEPTAYRLIRSGALPSVLIGGCRRVLHDEIVSFLNGLKAAREQTSGLTLVEA